MKSSLKANKIFSAMKENYFNKQLPVGFKSTHWDSFDRKFLVQLVQRMGKYASNQLTLGLNDNLIEISNRNSLTRMILEKITQKLRTLSLKNKIEIASKWILII